MLRWNVLNQFPKQPLQLNELGCEYCDHVPAWQIWLPLMPHA